MRDGLRLSTDATPSPQLTLVSEVMSNMWNGGRSPMENSAIGTCQSRAVAFTNPPTAPRDAFANCVMGDGRPATEVMAASHADLSRPATRGQNATVGGTSPTAYHGPSSTIWELAARKAAADSAGACAATMEETYRSPRDGPSNERPTAAATTAAWACTSSRTC